MTTPYSDTMAKKYSDTISEIVRYSDKLVESCDAGFSKRQDKVSELTEKLSKISPEHHLYPVVRKHLDAAIAARDRYAREYKKVAGKRLQCSGLKRSHESDSDDEDEPDAIRHRE